LNFNQN